MCILIGRKFGNGKYIGASVGDLPSRLECP